jgi:mannose-1-phosphate guanylyltransferase/mannose-6-phosphate isomerase
VSAGVVAALGQFPSSTVFVALPCDHLIRGDADFKSAIAQAVAVAEKGCLVTFGIGTTHASTEYGYIRRGDPLDRHNGAFQAAKFHEKPSAEMAKAYHADSEFYWNSGILVFRGDVFAVEAQRHMPNIWRAATEAVQRGAQKNLNIELDPGAFARAPKTSIDHALLEKSDRVALIPAAFQWSEVGSWAAVYRAQRGDKAKNVAAGDVALRDVSGSLVIADGVRVIVVGAQDLVVAASPRGTFVAPLSRAGEVKMLIENGDI